jgi:hypothetical protein
MITAAAELDSGRPNASISVDGVLARAGRSAHRCLGETAADMMAAIQR